MEEGAPAGSSTQVKVSRRERATRGLAAALAASLILVLAVPYLSAPLPGDSYRVDIASITLHISYVNTSDKWLGPTTQQSCGYQTNCPLFVNASRSLTLIGAILLYLASTNISGGIFATHDFNVTGVGAPFTYSGTPELCSDHVITGTYVPCLAEFGIPAGLSSSAAYNLNLYIRA